MLDLSILTSPTAIQAYSILTFIIGIILGEFLTLKFFGKPKPSALIIDLIIFVIVVSLLFNTVTFTESTPLYYIANVILGALTVIIVRAIETPLGLTEKDVQHEKTIINIVRTLSRHGLDKREIKEVLKKSGFSTSVVKRYDNLIDDHAPKYLTRMVKVERLVDEMKDSLDRLENHIIPEEEQVVGELKKAVRVMKKKRTVQKKIRFTKRKTKTKRRKLYKKTVKKVKPKKQEYIHPIRRIAMERNLLVPKKLRPRKRKRKKKKKRKVAQKKKRRKTRRRPIRRIKRRARRKTRRKPRRRRKIKRRRKPKRRKIKRRRKIFRRRRR